VPPHVALVLGKVAGCDRRTRSLQASIGRPEQACGSVGQPQGERHAGDAHQALGDAALVTIGSEPHHGLGEMVEGLAVLAEMLRHVAEVVQQAGVETLHVEAHPIADRCEMPVGCA
jgi:hypothetical protein